MGYWQALGDHGIPGESVPIYETRNDAESVAACLEDIFAQSEQPTALLAMSDRIAIATLDWLGEWGIRVPQDVSLVGSDGVPKSATSEPPLITGGQPLAEIARRAVHAILDDPVPAERETVAVRLVVRGSTAAAPNRTRR